MDDNGNILSGHFYPPENDPMHALRSDNDSLTALCRQMAQAAGLREKRIEKLEAELDRVKRLAIPFVAIRADQHARELGLPQGYLTPHFYDMLESLDADMSIFVRYVKVAMTDPTKTYSYPDAATYSPPAASPGGSPTTD